MSLNRLIFYGAVIGGWSAFIGWFLCEMLFFRLFGMNPNTVVAVVLVAAFVGAGIGGGLMTLGGIASGKWSGVPKRLGVGLLGGLGAGLVAGLIAGALFSAVPNFFFRILGWILLGVAIGMVDGIYEMSLRRLRNGLIGGAVGGFFGGLLLQPIAYVLASDSGMSGRCFGFVILGMCIGLLISLVQVVLKTAWLTVVDGFRPGRQLILTDTQTTLGTSEKVTLPFIAFGAKGVEPVHVVVYRQPDGRFAIQDNNTRSGTRLNGQPLAGPAFLNDGDVIQFGVNMVRFSEKRRAIGEAAVAGVPAQSVRTVSAQPVAVASHAVQVAPQQARPMQPGAVQAQPYPPQQPQQPSRPFIPIQPAAQPPQQVPRPAAPPQAYPPQPYPAAPQQYQPPQPPQQVPRPAAPQHPQSYPPQAQHYQPPPAQQPPRPAAPPQSAPQQPQAPQQPAAAQAVGSCPNCGFRTTGVPGKRMCIVCQQNF